MQPVEPGQSFSIVTSGSQAAAIEESLPYQGRCTLTQDVVEYFNKDNMARAMECNPENRHFQLSQKKITELSQQTTLTNHVAVLGSGNLSDIPIEHLCDRFRTVTLYDIDTQSSQEAAHTRLEGNKVYLDKIQYVATDLTGLFDTFSRHIAEIIESLPDNNKTAFFSEKLSELYQKLQTEAYVLPTIRADYVIASQVLSQLGVLIGDYAESKYHEKVPIEELPENLCFSEELKNLSQLLQLRFLQLLNDSCNEGGSIYLSCCHAVHVDTRSIGDDEWHRDEDNVLISKESFDKCCPAEAKHTVSEWEWLDLHGDGIRRVFDVTAFSIKEHHRP